MPLDIPSGGRVLGHGHQVQIREIHVLVPAGVQFTSGGCDIPGMVIRAEVVNIQSATQFVIPLDIQFAERLHKQLGELITDHNKQVLEG